MVSFSCEACGDVLTKKKLDAHRNKCWTASYTCLDCMQHFQGESYKAHTSCITEDQKYQGALYRDKKNKRGAVPLAETSTAMVPIKAYVEDEADAEMGIITVIDAPPQAPSPPSLVQSGQQTPVNVFDFMTDQSPTRPTIAKAKNGPSKPINPTKPKTSIPEGSYTYGSGPVPMQLQKYESDPNLLRPMLPPTTPAAGSSATAELTPIYEVRRPRDSKKDDGRPSTKRKRQQVEELDLSLVRRRDDPDAPGLHSGLTGGLQRLLRNPSPPLLLESPISPKRSKPSKSHDKPTRDGREKYNTERRIVYFSDDERNRRPRNRHPRSNSPDIALPKKLKAIEYRQTSLEPSSRHSYVSSSISSRHSHAELFISLVTKGPDSSKGQSVYTALKDFHGYIGGAPQINHEEKQLLKGLRMKRNKRGEVVLFARSAGDESP